MRCLTDEQVESLAARPDDGADAAPRRHAESCATCRQKVQAAQEDARLVGDIREFRERRAQVRTLVDSLPPTIG